jgi:fucose 4-O-acetylase-like acetyltransferase
MGAVASCNAFDPIEFDDGRNMEEALQNLLAPYVFFVYHIHLYAFVPRRNLIAKISDIQEVYQIFSSAKHRSLH